MKKLLSLAVAIAVSAPAMADIYTDVNYKHSKHDVREAAAKVGYVMDNGLSFDLENVYDFKNKKNKEVTLGTAWKFDVVENGYIQPLAEVTFNSRSSSETLPETKDWRKELNDKTFNLTENQKSGDTYKIGLKGGYDFDNGLYTSLRYRYEMNDGEWNIKGSGKYDKEDISVRLTGEKYKTRTHRTDLTLGYVIEDIADLSVNWVYKSSSTKTEGELIELIKHDLEKVRQTSSDFEFKAAANGLGDFVPYVQYTIKSKVNVKGSEHFIHGKQDGIKLKRENEIKVGLVYNF